MKQELLPREISRMLDAMEANGNGPTWFPRQLGKQLMLNYLKARNVTPGHSSVREKLKDPTRGLVDWRDMEDYC